MYNNPIPWKPHGYQEDAMRFLVEHPCAALLLDPGLGKSSITLGAIKVLKGKGLIRKVLVMAPLRVAHSVWPAELQKWSDFHDLRVEVLHGPHKDAALARDADIYVVNFEGLNWLFGVTSTRTANGKSKVAVDIDRVKSFGFDILVIDELSAFKHVSTNRFNTLKQVHHLFSRRWGLTGSPAANGLLDLFGQMYILDRGAALGPYITRYRQKYFTPSYDGFSWRIQEGAGQKIYERIAPLALRMAADDYLDMPLLVPNVIHLDLPDDVREFYNVLHRDLIASIKNETVVAATAASASIKCLQVACGGIYLDPQIVELKKVSPSARGWLDLHTAKVDALASLIDELQGSPLLVAYNFTHDLERLKRKFGKDIPYIGGGVSSQRSAELESAWNAGELPVLFGHPQSIGHGLNLQGAGNHVCWHSLTYNYELYDQFIRRVLRQGNTSKRVFVHHLVMRNTVDEAVLIALHAKERGQAALFAALKNMGEVR